ncbi:MAG: acylphosphatase [Anaerolineae bacterium]
MLLEMRAIIHGRVQGIGFRARTKAIADRLNLLGFVRNLSDGSVEICAQGDRATLDELVAVLKRDFGFGLIETVDVSFTDANVSFSDFKILKI